MIDTESSCLSFCSVALVYLHDDLSDQRHPSAPLLGSTVHSGGDVGNELDPADDFTLGGDRRIDENRAVLDTRGAGADLRLELSYRRRTVLCKAGHFACQLQSLQRTNRRVDNSRRQDFRDRSPPGKSRKALQFGVMLPIPSGRIRPAVSSHSSSRWCPLEDGTAR